MSEALARAFCAGEIDFGSFYSGTRERWSRVFFREQPRSHHGVTRKSVFDEDDYAQEALIAAARKASSFDPTRETSAWAFLAYWAVNAANRAAIKARAGRVRFSSKACEVEHSASEDEVDHSAESWPSLVDAARSLSPMEVAAFEALGVSGTRASNVREAAKLSGLDVMLVRGVREKIAAAFSASL